jgi:hypothetical protein
MRTLIDCILYTLMLVLLFVNLTSVVTDTEKQQLNKIINSRGLLIKA